MRDTRYRQSKAVQSTKPNIIRELGGPGNALEASEQCDRDSLVGYKPKLGKGYVGCHI